MESILNRQFVPSISMMIQKRVDQIGNLTDMTLFHDMSLQGVHFIDNTRSCIIIGRKTKGELQ